MPKNYPSILIDRNRKSRSEKHKFDYVVCLDGECGFVARVLLLQREAFEAFKKNVEATPDGDALNEIYLLKSGRAGVVLIIEAFIHDTVVSQYTRPKIKSLLAKSMKKYLFAEVAMVPTGIDTSLESQIKVLEDILKDLKSGYDRMTAHVGEAMAKNYIANVEAAIETIQSLRRLTR